MLIINPKMVNKIWVSGPISIEHMSYFVCVYS